MNQEQYIEVIVPVAIDFVPTYSTAEPLLLGQRVYVNFAGRTILGVVSRVLTEKPQSDFTIKKAGYSPKDLPLISEAELKFWRTISDYYLCPLGLIYKLAYPESKTDAEMTRHKEAVASEQSTEIQQVTLTDEQQSALSAICSSSKNALLSGPLESGKTHVALALAQDYFARAHSVLFLAPSLESAKKLIAKLQPVLGDNLLPHATQSKVQQRKTAEILRAGVRPYFVVGTSASLFLPYTELGLIVVSDEGDAAYKTTNPRINVRDAAFFLAQIHSSKVLLLSHNPSLETLYNVLSGKFSQAKLQARYDGAHMPSIEVVNTNSERRMGGMQERISKPLISKIAAALKRGEQAIVVRNYYEGVEDQVDNVLQEIFDSFNVETLHSDAPAKEQNALAKSFKCGLVDILVGTSAVLKLLDNQSVTVVAHLSVDSLFSREDYKGDELAVATIRTIAENLAKPAKETCLLLQTNNSDNQFLQNIEDRERLNELLFAQRSEYNYPPYSRVVSVVLQDILLPRAEKLGRLLREDILLALGTAASRITPLYSPEENTYIFKIFLRKDVSLKQSKTTIVSALKSFEEKHTYRNRIILSVD